MKYIKLVLQIIERGDFNSMQHLNVSLSIPIPDDYVVIKKVELEELQKEKLSGVFWSMKDLENRINKKVDWIKDNILYPSRFRRLLDSDNGGCVFYPRSKGQNWSFQANRMSEFLDKYFSQIFNS